VTTRPCQYRRWFSNHTEAENFARTLNTQAHTYKGPGEPRRWYVDWFEGVTSAAPVEWDPPFMAKEPM
jgi:hypothetical protein